MGAPNFSQDWFGIGGSFGVVPERPYRAEEIAALREECGFDDSYTDEEVADSVYEMEIRECEWYLEQAKDILPHRVRTVIERLWQFGEDEKGDFGIEFPYEVTFTCGYHSGWCVRLESAELQFDRTNEVKDNRTHDDLWCDLTGRSYRSLTRYSNRAPNVEYKDFKAHLDKVIDAVVWVFETYCAQAGLWYVHGGWTGGTQVVTEELLWEIDDRAKWEEMFPEFK